MSLSKNRTWSCIPDVRKNRTPKSWPKRKAIPQGLKTLLFVSSHMKDNVQVIHFHIKSRGVQGLVFVQIKFEKFTTNFYFRNGEVGIKTRIASLYPLRTWNVSASLCIFTQSPFQWKCVFMKLATFFISSKRCIFTKLLGVSES